ncbi:MAG TPA: 23S rRNA (guanosine(2251)-2'-O)-methyltransferase RlmB, partial [Candidatus Limnocylindria bacterium]|nr:23S rRNA (guanosine(2251)-2'-O)-methyltransferase RlmB [Candidatus Limnocylindria bacterium]
MEESEGRHEDPAPRQDEPQGEAAPPDAPRSFNTPNAGGGDFRDRPRRRGRRGRGGAAPGGQRFGAPRGPLPPRQMGQVGQMGPRPAMPPRDDEESSQARELAAYERRQQQRSRPAFRGPGWVAGSRPAAGGGVGGFRSPGMGGGFRPAGPGGFRGTPGGRPMGGGMRGPRRGTGAAYTDQIRRVTAGPRAQAAPSHEAGEPIAGPHAVLEAIRAGRVVKRLFISNERGTRTGPVNELIEEAQQRHIFVRYVEPMEVQRLSPIEGHQGVVAIVEGKAGVELDELILHLETLSEPALVLAIDSLQDPQNFGVLLRSAEGTGVDGVIIPKHRSVGITPAVAKTSAGASEHLMIADVANLRQAIDALKEKGIWVVGTDESGELLYDEVDYRGPTAIVIGGEAEGIRRLVLEGCDQVVRIPMEGSVASLNAAAAGTVVLYEALRQRRRNVAPADTRTPPPARTAVTPQEQGMGDVDEEAEDTLDDVAEENGEAHEDIEREDGVAMEDAAGAVASDLGDA